MHYPSRSPAPEWTGGVLAAFDTARGEIDSQEHAGVNSNAVLAAIRPSLEQAGFEVERGAAGDQRIRRPVLFGENGRPIVSYDVDAYHPGHGVVVEIEAGRGAANNADYRDLVRACLMVDARYLVIAMMLRYTAGSNVMRSYDQTRRRLDAIYASDRLKVPLEGLLLIGY